MKRMLLFGATVLLLITLSACGSETATDATTTAATTTTICDAKTTTTATPTTTSQPIFIQTVPKPTTSKPILIQTVPKTTTTAATTAGTTVGTTTARQGACDLAASYLAQAAFSYDGLVKQLKAAGCTEADATYAADNCGADWNQQAAKRMQYHLDGMGFGRQQLIQMMLQDGFTEVQITYALQANNV